MKDKKLDIRVSAQELEEIREMAGSFGLSISDLVREAIDELKSASSDKPHREVHREVFAENSDAYTEVLLRDRDLAFRLRGKSEDFRELWKRIDDVEDFQRDEIEIRLEYLEKRFNILASIVGASNDRRLKC